MDDETEGGVGTIVIGVSAGELCAVPTQLGVNEGGVFGTGESNKGGDPSEEDDDRESHDGSLSICGGDAGIESGADLFSGSATGIVSCGRATSIGPIVGKDVEFPESLLPVGVNESATIFDLLSNVQPGKYDEIYSPLLLSDCIPSPILANSFCREEDAKGATLSLALFNGDPCSGSATMMDKLAVDEFLLVSEDDFQGG